jgi:hypothetical protein
MQAPNACAVVRSALLRLVKLRMRTLGQPRKSMWIDRRPCILEKQLGHTSLHAAELLTSSFSGYKMMMRDVC